MSYIDLQEGVRNAKGRADLEEISKTLESLNVDTLTDEQKEELHKFINEIAIERARENFYSYVQVIAPTLTDSNTFYYGKHIEIICKELQELYESVITPGIPTKRTQIFMPPGSMKSLLSSILFPSWCLGKSPNFQFIVVGNATKNAENNFGMPTRQVMMSEEYRTIFPDTKLRQDAKSVGRFRTTKGGVYFVTGAGSAIAGSRAHITIIDDALSEQTAWSSIERNRLNKWYIAGLRSRLFPTPQGAELIINTRWHMDDLSAYTLKVDANSVRPWNVISFPAILTKEAAEMYNKFPSNDQRGSRVFKEGDSFWPEFHPLENLLSTKESLMITNPSQWNALYMQSPVPEEGGIVKYDDWENWDKRDNQGNLRPPEIKSVIVSMDTAFSTSEQADFSAIEVWGVFNLSLGPGLAVPSLILLWAEKGKWEFDELRMKAISLYNDERWPTPDMYVIEKKASGQSLIQVLRNQLPIWEYTPDKDKRSRLFACTPYFRQGRIYAPMEKEWAMEVVDEVCNFPSAPNDDLVDACSQAILFFKDNQDIYLDDDGFAFQGDGDLEGPSKHKKRTLWSVLSGTKG